MMTTEAGENRVPKSGLGLWALQASLAVLASLYVLFIIPMNTGACAPRCDYSLLSASTWMFIVFAIGLAVAVAVVLVVIQLRRHEQPPRVWWIPALGIALTLIAGLISVNVSAVAMGTDHCYTYIDCR